MSDNAYKAQETNDTRNSQNTWLSRIGSDRQKSMKVESDTIYSPLVAEKPRARRKLLSTYAAIGRSSHKAKGKTSVSNVWLSGSLRKLVEIVQILVQLIMILMNSVLGLLVAYVVYQNGFNFLIAVFIGKVTSFSYNFLVLFLFKYLIMGEFESGEFSFFSWWFYKRR